MPTSLSSSSQSPRFFGPSLLQVNLSARSCFDYPHGGVTASPSPSYSPQSFSFVRSTSRPFKASASCSTAPALTWTTHCLRFRSGPIPRASPELVSLTPTSPLPRRRRDTSFERRKLAFNTDLFLRGERSSLQIGNQHTDLKAGRRRLRRMEEEERSLTLFVPSP